MSIDLGRRVGGILAVLVFGLLWTHGTSASDRLEQLWRGDIPTGLALTLTGLAFIAIYLLLRPPVSK